MSPPRRTIGSASAGDSALKSSRQADLVAHGHRRVGTARHAGIDVPACIRPHEPPPASRRTADLELNRPAGRRGYRAVGVRQASHRDIEHHLKPSRIPERSGIDGVPDLRSVMPDFGELAADMEPRG